jgi:uncharacterized protein with PQ loop repeat
MVDGALCVQWLYYVKHRNNFVRRWIDGKSNIALEEEDEDDKLIKEQRFIKDLPAIEASSSSSGKELVNEEESLLGTSQGVNSKKNYSTMYFIFTFVSFGLTSSSTTLFTEPNLDSYNNNLINNLIVDIAQAKDNTIWVGRFFAWVCAILYLASRVPQLYRNARRRSVEGLSMALFFFAFMGNFTYMLGIFANPHATRASMLEAVPYILGSGGTLIFDGAIFVQYAIFNSKYSGVAIEHA